MITLTLKNQWCYYSDIIVRKHTRFSVPNPNDHIYKVNLNLSDRKQARFPVGLLFIVEKRLKKNGIAYEVRDENVYEYKDCSEKYGLRSYQKEAVEKVLEKKQGILKHPTGSGKTRTAICLAECVQGPVLFLVDTISLVGQTVRAYNSLTGDRASVITSKDITIKKFNIATLQTLHSISQTRDISNLFETITCVIIDECHILGAHTYYKVARSIPAQWRIGLSATPTNRTDGLDPLVVAATGGIIHSIPMADLIDAKNLARPYIIFYDYSENRYKYDRYNYKEVITYNRDRNIAILKICRVAPKPCLLFYEYKQHGYLLEKNLRNLGYSVDLVHGLHNGFQRDQAIQDLVNGDTEILLTSRIFNKGVNIPELRSCINAAGWKAYIPTIQKLGRGTRKIDGKDKILFFDFHDVENSTTLSHSRERRKNYKAENLNTIKLSNIQDIDNYINKISV